MSKLITNTIRHTGGSADNITLDNSQNVTIEGNATVDGKAGIGVTSPADNSILHVKSSDAADYRPLVVEGSATNGSGVSIWNSGAQRIFVGSGGGNNVSGSSTTDGLIRAENNLQFGVGNSLKATIQSDGDVKINDGDLVFGTAGKGICLGVTSNTDSNTLDDYEEGTWTPVLQGSSSAGTTTYHGSDNRRGHYIKIGRKVTVWLTIGWGAATGTGDLEIHGLPFAVDNTSYADPNGNVQAFGIAYTVNVKYPSSTNGYVQSYTWGGAGTKMIFAMSRDDDGTAMVKMTDGYNETSDKTKYIGTTLTYQVA